MAINIKPEDKILVVAPHPDDESIGCGGIISLYATQTDVLLITDGYSREIDNKELSEKRNIEFQTAMKRAGINDFEMLHIHEHNIYAEKTKLKCFDFGKYTKIFVPNRYENHEDHVAVYRLVKKYAGKKARIFEYEVWTTIRNPNIIVDIESVIEKKRDLISCHASQVSDLDYISLSEGLNAYRGLTHGLKYAEAFYCKSELREEKKRHFKRKIRNIMRK